MVFFLNEKYKICFIFFLFNILLILVFLFSWNYFYEFFFLPSLSCSDFRIQMPEKDLMYLKDFFFFFELLADGKI